MGFLDKTARISDLPVADQPAVPEIAMLSEGLLIRVGADPDDLCLIEDLGIGDAIWDVASGRMVDIDAMACATLDAEQLAEMGLRPAQVSTAQGMGWLALSSSRLINRDTKPASLAGASRVFFRLWPETRVLAEVQGRQVLFRSM